MKKNIYTGFILIALGVLFLLYNLNMFDLTWILFLTSIALIIRYIIRRDIIYLILGLGLLAFTSVSLIDRYIFIGLNIQIFVYLLVGGCGVLYLYYKHKNRNWLILGSVLIALSINNIAIQIFPMINPWSKYFFISLAFYASYLIAYRSNRILWPKYISYILLVIGGIRLFISRDLMVIEDLSLSHLIPIIIIVIGARIIYLATKNR